MNAKTIELIQGRLRVGIAAAQGGRLLNFYALEADGSRWDYMRPAPSEDADARDCASFPLVPYSNRIADAQFEFQGQSIHLSRNFPPEPHAIHGTGWEGDWVLEAADSTSAKLSYTETGEESWPWSFQAVQHFQLDEDGLSLDISVRNTDTTAMPAGLGFHPYFPTSAMVTLTLSATGLIEKDGHGLPLRINPDDATLPLLQTGERLPLGLDTGLEGWEGTARIEWPEAGRGLTIEAPGVDRAVFYSPIGKGYFCLEPVSHVTNAHNRLPDGIGASGIGENGGLRVLQPGEAMSMSVRFRPD